MLPQVDTMTQLNLFKYVFYAIFVMTSCFTSLNGPLSREVPSKAINAVNKEVKEVMASNIITKKRGSY